MTWTSTSLHRVISADMLVPTEPGRTVRLWLHAPDVARSCRPGQFLILRMGPSGERIPLTIVARRDDGNVCVVVQEVGKTTGDFVALREGDVIDDVCGPLGLPSEIEAFGTCVMVAGGYGSAAVLPIAIELANAGNRVISILGARTGPLVILADELAACSDKLHIATEDGSKGERGTVLDPLRSTIETEKVDRVLAIGPIGMMRAVADVTRPHGIPTVVSLNPIMLDGTGMCGACRVRVSDETRFACLDGPEFDGHSVDFDELALRLGSFRPQERLAMEVAGA